VRFLASATLGCQDDSGSRSDLVRKRIDLLEQWLRLGLDVECPDLDDATAVVDFVTPRHLAAVLGINQESLRETKSRAVPAITSISAKAL